MKGKNMRRMILTLVAALALLSQSAMAGTTGLGASPFSSGGQFTHTDGNAMANATDDNAGDIADIVTLSGKAANSTHLGTFSGATIADSSTIYAALQAIETAYEAHAADVTAHVVAEAYDALGWDGDGGAASKNDVRDKIESLGLGAGDVTSVLDCLTGACSQLSQAPTAFADGDTTPDVSSGNFFITANTAPTTYVDFDTSLVNGQFFFLIVNDTNSSFSFTASGLEGTGDKDHTARNGELLIGVYSTVDSQWHMLFWPSVIGVSSIELPSGANPTVDSTGEVAIDTDGANEASDLTLRAYDGANTIALARKLHCVQATAIKPQDWADSERDLFPFWQNNTGMVFTITEIKAWSDTDDTTVTVELVPGTDWSSPSTVDALEIATNGTSVFTDTQTTITDPTVAHDEILTLDFDDTDDPGMVKICVCGWFNGAVD